MQPTVIRATGVLGSQPCGKSSAPSRSTDFSSDLSRVMFGVKRWQPTLLSREQCHWGGELHSWKLGVSEPSPTRFYLIFFKKSDSPMLKSLCHLLTQGHPQCSGKSLDSTQAQLPTAASVSPSTSSRPARVYTEGKWVIVHYVASAISDPDENILWVWHQEWQQRTDSERAAVPKPRLFP